MALPNDRTLPDDSPGGLVRGRIRYVPVVPGRMEFAELVHEEILRHKPRVVAVDLPVTLEAAYGRSVDRLPELSVIIYDDEGEDRAVYMPVEPCDPFVEALRSAREVGAEAVFLDPDVSDRVPLDDAYPDSYAVRRIGIEKYVESHRVNPRPRSNELTVQAEGLAWKLQGTDPEASVLAVVSLKLLDALLDAMEHPQTQPLRKVRRKGVRVLNLHPECLAEVLTEMPFVQAVYETRREEAAGAGQAPAEEAPVDGTPVDEAPASGEGLRNVRGFSVIDAPKEDPTGAAIRRVAREPLDRQRLHVRLFSETQHRYETKTGESVAVWQRRLWARYTRNMAVLQNQLLAGLFELTVAARSIVDDNMGWELWEMAGAYPAQKIETDLMTVKLTGEQMWLNTRRIQLRRRLPRKKARLRPTGLRGRKGETRPGEWRREWKGFSICSYPPEDLVIENYGLFLKKKGKSVLSEERSHSEPFTTSLLDGHRPPRDASPLAREEDLRPRAATGVGRGRGDRHHLRQGPRQPLLLLPDLAGRTPERVRHGFLRHRPVRERRRPRHRPLRVRRPAAHPALGTHVRRLARPRLLLRRIEAGASAASRARLLAREVCCVRRAEPAAIGVPQHRRTPGPEDHLHPDRPTLARGPQEGACHARA